jgi:hypothetical protein
VCAVLYGGLTLRSALLALWFVTSHSIAGALGYTTTTVFDVATRESARRPNDKVRVALREVHLS